MRSALSCRSRSNGEQSVPPAKHNASINPPCSSSGVLLRRNEFSEWWRCMDAPVASSPLHPLPLGAPLPMLPFEAIACPSCAIMARSRAHWEGLGRGAPAFGSGWPVPLARSRRRRGPARIQIDGASQVAGSRWGRICRASEEVDRATSQARSSMKARAWVDHWNRRGGLQGIRWGSRGGQSQDDSMTAVGFEPTPLRNGALSHRLRPLGQTVSA